MPAEGLWTWTAKLPQHLPLQLPIISWAKKLQLRTAGRPRHPRAARGGFQTTQNLNQPSRTHSPTSRIHSKNIANAAGPSNPNKPQRAHGRAFATATIHMTMTIHRAQFP